MIKFWKSLPQQTQAFVILVAVLSIVAVIGSLSAHSQPWLGSQSIDDIPADLRGKAYTKGVVGFGSASVIVLGDNNNDFNGAVGLTISYQYTLHGIVRWNIVQVGGNYTLKIYKSVNIVDSNMVAQSDTVAAGGTLHISAVNGTGVSGLAALKGSVTVDTDSNNVFICYPMQGMLVWKNGANWQVRQSFDEPIHGVISSSDPYLLDSASIVVTGEVPVLKYGAADLSGSNVNVLTSDPTHTVACLGYVGTAFTAIGKLGYFTDYQNYTWSQIPYLVNAIVNLPVVDTSATISSMVTGSGTSGYRVKFTGTGIIGNGGALDSLTVTSPTVLTAGKLPAIFGSHAIVSTSIDTANVVTNLGVNLTSSYFTYGNGTNGITTTVGLSRLAPGLLRLQPGYTTTATDTIFRVTGTRHLGAGIPVLQSWGMVDSTGGSQVYRQKVGIDSTGKIMQYNYTGTYAAGRADTGYVQDMVSPPLLMFAYNVRGVNKIKGDSTGKLTFASASVSGDISVATLSGVTSVGRAGASLILQNNTGLSSATSGVNVLPSLSSSNSAQAGLLVNPTDAQSSTGTFVALQVKPTMNTAGSGANRLLQWGTNSTTEKGGVDTSGTLIYLTPTTGANTVSPSMTDCPITITAQGWATFKGLDGNVWYFKAIR